LIYKYILSTWKVRSYQSGHNFVFSLQHSAVFKNRIRPSLLISIWDQHLLKIKIKQHCMLNFKRSSFKLNDYIYFFMLLNYDIYCHINVGVSINLFAFFDQHQQSVLNVSNLYRLHFLHCNDFINSAHFINYRMTATIFFWRSAFSKF
jgi:hypothetical protein